MSTTWKRPRPAVTTTPQLPATAPLSGSRATYHAPLPTRKSARRSSSRARLKSRKVSSSCPSSRPADLDLDDRVPELLVRTRRGVERPHDDLAVLPRVRRELIRLGDEADALVDVVAARAELLARRADLTVRAVPAERAMPHPRLVRERLVEQRLPAGRVARGRLAVEEEEVAPVVRRVAGRAHEQVPVAPLDHAVEPEHVDVGRPHERARHGGLFRHRASVRSSFDAARALGEGRSATSCAAPGRARRRG